MPATKKKPVKKKTAPKVKPQPSTPEGLRVRNKEIRRVRVGDIIENPHNFRGHGELQRRSFRATVDEIGYYGYQDVFEHPDYPDKVMLVDGELRKDDLVQQYGEDAYIDVNVTDFDAEDAKKALATKDPLAAMASNESQKMHELLKDMESESPAFNDLLAHLADDYVDDVPEAPKEFPEVSESITVEHVCPKCNYAFSGGETRVKHSDDRVDKV